VFGRHDDVIKQDQQRDAKVLFPPSAVSALTDTPAENSETDRPGPTASSAPEQRLHRTSVDGFSAPTGNLDNPMSYTRRAVVADSNDDNVTPSNPPEPDMQPIELSNEGAENATYMNHLTSANNLDDDGIGCSLHGRRRADGRPAKPDLCSEWPPKNQGLHPGCVFAPRRRRPA
jgi:hypothetical protein